MIAFPTPYTACKHPGLTYSVGVIRNHLGAACGEYPLVRCGHCHTTHFTRFPFTDWYACDEVERRIAFTEDPAAIDHRIKLGYETRYIGVEGEPAQPIYSVFLAFSSVH